METRKFYIEHRNNIRLVGQLFDDHFVKRAKKSVHLFRKGNAWGISEEVVERLKDTDCDLIIIRESEEAKYYAVKFDVFVENSWVHTFQGFEQQRFLALDWWDIYSVPEGEEFIWGNRELLEQGKGAIPAQPPPEAKVGERGKLREQSSLFNERTKPKRAGVEG